MIARASLSTLTLSTDSPEALMEAFLNGDARAFEQLFRQLSPRAPRASGALAGASAGFGALLFLQLHCPSQMALHLHIVHALPLALSMVIGALAGRRWLAA